MSTTQFTRTKNGFRWVLALRGSCFIAYPQQRCLTDTGKPYFKFCHAPVAFFESATDRATFIAGASAELWAKGEN